MGKNKRSLVSDNGEAWMVSIPFADVSELRKEVGNALWLLVGLTGLVTKEYIFSGVRVGEVLGGARISDAQLAHSFNNSFPALSIRTWRRRLLKAGLIIQRRIPSGLQIAVVGTKKFNKAPSQDISQWMADQISAMLGETDLTRSIRPTQLSRLDRPNQVDWTDPAKSKQLRMKEECKRDQKRNTPPTPQGGVSERFTRFWNSYPRKIGKGSAERLFNRIKPDEALLNRMIQAIEAWQRSDDWTRESGRFVPHPTTWLNRRGWEDELPPKQVQADESGWM